MQYQGIIFALSAIISCILAAVPYRILNPQALLARRPNYAGRPRIPINPFYKRAEPYYLRYLPKPARGALMSRSGGYGGGGGFGGGFGGGLGGGFGGIGFGAPQLDLVHEKIVVPRPNVNIPNVKPPNINVPPVPDFGLDINIPPIPTPYVDIPPLAGPPSPPAFSAPPIPDVDRIRIPSPWVMFSDQAGAGDQAAYSPTYTPDGRSEDLDRVVKSVIPEPNQVQAVKQINKIEQAVKSADASELSKSEVDGLKLGTLDESESEVSGN